MSQPRFQLIVDVIPISEAALRALTAGYRYRQRMREAMANKAAVVQAYGELEEALTNLYAAGIHISEREIQTFVKTFNGRV